MKSFFYRFLLLLAISLPLTAQSQVCNDLTEPNDNLGQSYDLGVVTSSLLYDSLCLTAGDQDFLRFSHAGNTYFVRVRGFSSSTQGRYGVMVRVDSSFLSVTTYAVGGSRTDTYLYLSDINGVTLGENDDFNRTLFSQVRYNFINPIFLSVNPSQLTLAASGDSASFTVAASNITWTATAPNWLTLSSVSGGNGTTTIRVFAAQNATNRNRLGYISITGTGNMRRGIWVNQPSIPFSCADANEPNNTRQEAINLGTLNGSWQDTSLCLSPASDEDFFAITINNNAYYIRIKGFSFNTVGRYGLRISYAQDIISVTTFATNAGENTDTYVYLMNANGDVLAQNDDFGGTFYSQINYNTNITPFLRITPTNINFPAMNARMVISVQATSNWTFNNLPTWVTASPMSGGVGTTNVVLTATNNLDTNARIAMLMASGGGQGMTITMTQQGITPSTLNCVDRFEPNNAVAVATTINNLVAVSRFIDSSLCLTLGDEDFFRFRIDTVVYTARVRGFSQNSLGRYGLNIQRVNGGFTVSTFRVGTTTTDTYLYVMNQTGINILGQNDDFGGTFFSSVTISTLPITPASNDDPCNAIELRDTLPVVGNLTNATLTTRPSPAVTIPGNTSCPSNARDIWFTAVMPSSGVLTIRTTANTLRDAVIAVYRGNSCDSIFEPALICEDDNRDGNGSFMPVVTVVQAPGTRIYIRVWAFGSQVGLFNLVALPYATPNLTGGNNNAQTNKQGSAEQINAYPNPASTSLTVNVKANESQKAASVALIDALGRIVWSEKRALLEGFNQFDIDVNNISNGLYFLRVDNQMVRVQIFH